MSAILAIVILQGMNAQSVDDILIEKAWAAFDQAVAQHQECIVEASSSFSKLNDPSDVVARGAWAACVTEWENAQIKQREATANYERAHQGSVEPVIATTNWDRYWADRREKMEGLALANVMTQRRLKAPR